MPRYHGKKGMIYISVDGSTAAIALVGGNKWSLNSNTDKAEVSAFGDSNKVYVQGLPDISGEIAAVFDTLSDQLYDASRSADGVKLYLYPSTDAPTKYFAGPAWTDFSIDVPANGPVTISGGFSANGAWTQQ